MGSNRFNIPGVPKVYFDRVIEGCNFYDYDEETHSTLYVQIDRKLVAPPPGAGQFVVPPVYSCVPSQHEVRALCERFRMVTGALPHVVLVPKIEREVLIVGYNVLLRGFRPWNRGHKGDWRSAL